MAAWEDTLKGLGADGKQLAADLKAAFNGIDDDFSSFLQTEATRIKDFLKMLGDGDIDKDVFETLMRGEKRLIQAHADNIASGVEEKTEKAVTTALLSATVKLIALI